MTSKPLRFHPEAEQEYLTALGWYRERSVAAANQLEIALIRSIGKISGNPRRWPMYVGEFRKYTLRQFPFSIVYQEFSSEIVVFAVAHARRHSGYWKDRTAGKVE
jgi:plasmid stabilization system protein ParE